MARLTSTVASRLVAQALGKDAKFVIVQLGKGESLPVYDGHGELLKFANGADAARQADFLTRDTGIKHQPRPVNDDAWRKREEDRIKAKDYLPLPWAAERWWGDLKPVWGDHYPHASVDKEAFVAFTESADKGAADIQTRIKPGRYLERYFGDAGILSPFVIRDLCSKFSNKYEENIVSYAVTADEIEDVYVNGPSSCMSKGKDSYPTKGVHPVRMYAAGDLQVAYLKRDGRPSARVIIWPEKKQYNASIYGDAARLRPILTKMGYQQGNLDGARLMMKKTNAQSAGVKGAFNLVIPHVDNSPGMYVHDGFVKLGRAPNDLGNKLQISCSGGAGYTELVVEGCPGCEETKVIQPVRNLMAVVNGPKESDLVHMCAACIKVHAFRDRYCGNWVHKDQGVLAHVETRCKPELVWSKWVGTYVKKADDDGELYDKGMLYAGPRGKMLSPNYAKANMKRCQCGKMVGKNIDDCDAACKKRWSEAQFLRSAYDQAKVAHSRTVRERW